MSTVNGTEHVEYRTIERFPGHRFGDDGSVWSRLKLGRTKSPDYLPAGEWRCIKQQRARNGYLSVQIRAEGEAARGKRRLVHRLILEAFAGPCPIGMECCHKDHDRSNNRASNLRWGTSRQNVQERMARPSHQRGEAKAKAKLKESDVREILRSRTTPSPVLAARYKVSSGIIRRIWTGRGWHWVSRGI